MPAYNAEKTLKKTYDEIPKDIVDDVILTDDASQDETVKLSRELDIKTFVHKENRGYGGNQKTCYQAALKSGADIVIMLHPDYQYSPKLITPMAFMIAEGIFDAVIASRILGNKAMMGGNAALQIHFEPCFNSGREPDHPAKTFRVSLGLSGLQPKSFGNNPATGKFKRFRVRQPDAMPDPVFWL